MVDEWSGFAALLANLIEKYAVVLDIITSQYIIILMILLLKIMK